MTTHQKSPSPWMILAIAQSYLLFFVFPDLCRIRIWPQIFGSLSPQARELLSSMIAPMIYWGYSLSMVPIYYLQHPFFEQYKIQSDQSWPWLDKRPEVRHEFWKLSRKSLKLACLNLFVFLPFAVSLRCKALVYLNIEHMSFETDDASWPSHFTILRDNILLTVLHEFGFYWTHRIMHTYPSLYKYHKVHHEYKINTAFAAQHNHPVDYFISILTPVLFATTLIGSHSMSVVIFMVWAIMANMDDHVGYSFPWSPVRWFPFAALTDEHEFHHSKNLGCFGSKLSIFNELFGGYKHYALWVRNETIRCATDRASVKVAMKAD